MIIDLSALPDQVNANDEDMFKNVCETLCVAKGVDIRFAHGNVLDEYHDVPLQENYPDLPDVDDLSIYDPGHVVLIPKEAMIDLADAEMDYYSTHEPIDHVDDDITKPSKPGYLPDTLQCFVCETEADFLTRDTLTAMTPAERERPLREYLDQFVPFHYILRPAVNTVTYYHIYSNIGRLMGSVQYNDLTHIIVPSTQEARDSGLLEMQAAFLTA